MTSRRTRERLVQRLRDEGIKDERVLEVIRSTPRHIFVDEALATRAYENNSLPIGHGQTISQPYIVARMTEALLRDGPVERVLEIGTGSGYQTAVLAQLVDHVFTVERIEALQRQARKRLYELRLNNVRYKFDDGHMGWVEKSPFDAIIVTAAPQDVPVALLHQLANRGRLIIPTGGNNQQVLRLITRDGNEFIEEHLDAVRFVPLLSNTL
ncbi:MAG: protein-L-isoaspartate(D-aspartate) O-methyltransferase [Gammaproteobacteria bacterium]|nr:protein-L-isoaspartate(D-aspartate) O-methyltransferase [Gammaproteobacteria bacterium]MDH5693948.1 protein-L-isoaspartate(D-aspartate) O-methyltransferase [Gammaproteobacteria bacterium]